MVPAAIFIRRRPEDFGLLLDGDLAPAQSPVVGVRGGSSRPATAIEQTWTLREVLRSKTVWAIVIILQLSQWGGGVYFSEPAYFTDLGYSKWIGTLSLTVHGASAAVVGLAVGFLAERLPLRYCAVAEWSAPPRA